MKKIIIIGASSGIGRKLALDFSAKGYHVGIAARREDKLREIAEESRAQMTYMALDVTAPDAEERLNALIEKNGGMDILLLASGVGFSNPEMNEALDNNIIAVNVKGFTTIINAAYKYFKKTASARKGQIAAITSIAGTKGLGIAAAYSASKRYQQNYLQAIAQLAHMQDIPLYVTDIRPGFVKTELLDSNKKYPLIMSVDHVAPLIEKAVIERKKVAVVDWKWRVITCAWKCIPNWIWRYMKVKTE